VICPRRKSFPRWNARVLRLTAAAAGSHYILVKDKLRTVVPYHKSVKVGTLKAILNQIKMSLEDFQKLL